MRGGGGGGGGDVGGLIWVLGGRYFGSTRLQEEAP